MSGFLGEEGGEVEVLARGSRGADDGDVVGHLEGPAIVHAGEMILFVRLGGKM